MSTDEDDIPPWETPRGIFDNYEPGELDAAVAEANQASIARYHAVLREIEAERRAAISKLLEPLLDRMMADRRDEKDFMLAGRLAQKMTRSQISRELDIGMAEVAARVDELRNRHNPEFEHILGTRRPKG